MESFLFDAQNAAIHAAYDPVAVEQKRKKNYREAKRWLKCHA
jgi:hypothetical protein